MSHKVPVTAASETLERKHEPDAIWVRMVASLGIGLLVVVILALIGIAGAFYVLMPHALSTHAGTIWRNQNQDPGVEPNQAYDREKMQAEEETYLQQFSWEDKNRGIARIPIKLGIDLMVERKMKVKWPSTTAETAPAESSLEGEMP